MTIPPERMAEIEARCAAATEGPWEFQELDPDDRSWGACEIWPMPASEESPVATMVCGVENAAFIALSRTAAPALAQYALDASAEIERLREALLMAASHCQGGHSEAGRAIADVFGIPFPVRMDTLAEAAKRFGMDPAKLWPWLAEMRQARAASEDKSHDHA